MDLRLLTTPWQRALGAMFRSGLGDTGLVFLYPFAAPRLFHTYFCPPLRLTALSEQGWVVFDRVAPARRFVRLPPTRLVLESDPAAGMPPLEDLRALLRLPAGVPPASWDEAVSADRLVDKILELAVADMRRAYEAHHRAERVRPEVLRASFAPWERGASGGRHRRTARLWPAWLRRAWPQAGVWAGWSEVALGRLRPDALAWGEIFDREALFWLEVEGGNASREALRLKTARRFEAALGYARRCSLGLVFALLGPPWVRQAAAGAFVGLPGDAAVVLADWKAFGTLPVPRWGSVRGNFA